MRFLFWRIITPAFLVVRDALLFLGVIWHDPARQRFRLGSLVSGRTPQDLVLHLERQGFHNHFIAWVDEGQVYSLRRVTSDRVSQYHLRIFLDGEVRGHFEYTPEAHPLWHHFEHGAEERREEFLGFLGDFITPAPREIIPLKMEWPLSGKIEGR